MADNPYKSPAADIAETQPTNSARSRLGKGMRIGLTWFGWYFAVFVCEAVTTPAIWPPDLGSDTFVVLSGLLLLIGAYRVARRGARPGPVFCYGCGGALLFVRRYIEANYREFRFGEPNIGAIVFGWIVVSLVLGFVCSFLGTIATERRREQPPDETASRD